MIYKLGKACYIRPRQRSKFHMVSHRKPRRRNSEAFIMGWAVLFIIPVQPLAYVVGNYTCQYGDKKRSKFQLIPPPSYRKESQQSYYTTNTQLWQMEVLDTITLNQGVRVSSLWRRPWLNCYEFPARQFKFIVNYLRCDTI